MHDSGEGQQMKLMAEIVKQRVMKKRVEIIGRGMRGDGGRGAQTPRLHRRYSRVDHLVDRFKHVRLQHERFLNLVGETLGLVERAAVECAVETVRDKLENLFGDLGSSRGIDRLDSELLAGELEAGGNKVDADDPLGSLEESPLGCALSDGSKTDRTGILSVRPLISRRSET